MNMYREFTYLIDKHELLPFTKNESLPLEQIFLDRKTIFPNRADIRQIYNLVGRQRDLLKSRCLHPTFLKVDNILYEQIMVDSFNRCGNGFPDKFLDLIILVDENADPLSPKVYCTQKEEMDSNEVIHDMIHEYRRK